MQKRINPVVVAWSAIGCTVAVALFTRPEYPDLALYSLAALAWCLLYTIPFLIHRDPRRIGLLMALSLTFIFYFVPLLRESFASYYRYRYAESDLAKAALSSLAGMVSITGGWFIAARIGVPPLLKNLRRQDVSPPLLAHAAFWLSILSIALVVFSDLAWKMKMMLGRLVFVMDQMPMLAVVCASLAVFSGHKNILFRIWIFGIFLPFSLLLIVSHTLMYHAALLLVPIFMIYVMKTQRIPWVWIVVVYLSLFPAFKSRIEARKEFGWGYQFSLVERLKIGAQRVIEPWTEESEGKLERRDVFAAERLNTLSLFAHCIHAHEYEGKPFYYGGTFWWLPLSPLPRLVFPWKPVNDHGHTFGVAYDLKDHDADFAVVLPLMVESYINGGLIGVILINLLIGALYYLCFAAFEHGRGTLNLIALGSVVYFIFNVEGNITKLFGGAMQAMALWFVIDRFFFRESARQKAMPKAQTERFHGGSFDSRKPLGNSTGK